MQEWDPILRDLADGPDDYDRQGGLVLLTRQGRDYAIELRQVPGGGLCVATSDDGTHGFVPISTYVQTELLGLPSLAKQIAKATTRSFQSRPGKFVEGPAEYALESGRETWPTANEGLFRALSEADPGTTRLVQLMAHAGKGKTVLLEQVAKETALAYRPDPYPVPILLNVDLLGRYVGTVDDAIAGSLSNTYVFPRLTQRDVVLCIRRRWLVLALDGFDELVARVGVRDAFARITELLDQLKGSGTLVLSARESFFELYQISTAIRTYLQPRVGSYTTMTVKLLPWTENEGRQVFSGLGSDDPSRDLDALTETFAGDREIVFHPFFLTRLADLWQKGERFKDADRYPNGLARTRFVIETFVDRESGVKWVDRDSQRPLLSSAEHVEMLSVIAEEMWQAGAFRLGLEELRLATAFAMDEMKVPPYLAEQVVERIPTHAALVNKDRGYSFLHDKFFHFALGHRIAALIVTQQREPLRRVFAARELAPAVIEWTTWQLLDRHVYGRAAVELIDALGNESTDNSTSNNVASLIATIADGRDDVAGIVLSKRAFTGDVLRAKHYKGLGLHDCSFWSIDLSRSVLDGCEFRHCVFSDMKLDESTSLARTSFEDCQFGSVELGEDVRFAPNDIEKVLSEHGAFVNVARTPGRMVSASPRVSAEAARCVEKLVRASMRTCDVVAEEFQENWGNAGARIIRLARKHGVLREIQRDASGPRKTFVRFAVDRDRLLKGQSTEVGDAAIEGFWTELGQKFPPSTGSSPS